MIRIGEMNYRSTDCEADALTTTPFGLDKKWKRWPRSFNLYVNSKGCKDDQEKLLAIAWQQIEGARSQRWIEKYKQRSLKVCKKIKILIKNHQICFVGSDGQTKL